MSRDLYPLNASETSVPENQTPHCGFGEGGTSDFPFPGEERIQFQFFSALSRELHFEYSVAPSLLVEDNAINSEILGELLPEA